MWIGASRFPFLLTDSSSQLPHIFDSLSTWTSSSFWTNWLHDFRNRKAFPVPNYHHIPPLAYPFQRLSSRDTLGDLNWSHTIYLGNSPSSLASWPRRTSVPRQLAHHRYSFYFLAIWKTNWHSKMSGDDSKDQTVKHPLQSEWTLWYFKADKSKKWEDNLRDVAKFSSVEDFWA